jgi:SPP1 gp7 family putative phage head morphogenesis protein
MAFQVSADPSRFDEAADWFLRRLVLTRQEAGRLGSEASQRAFWIGGGLQLEQIQRVFDKIAKAIENGTPFDEWRKQVKGELRNDAHAETVFRNATQRALNAGRWRQMREPGVLAFRPYWLFDGIEDARQSQICRVCNRVLLPADHPWWATHTPQLHHRCRSSIRSLRRAEAQGRGITNVPPVVEAQDGFGLSPDAEPEWRPDPSRYDPALLRELSRKQLQGRTPPAPAAPPVHDPKHWEERYGKKYGEAAPTVAWGRAMLERGLDRSAADVIAELERLQAAGHPMVDTEAGRLALAILRQVDPNRPLRDTWQGQLARSYVAISEHTRTIQTGEFRMLGVPLPKGAQAFFDLTLDKSVRRPSDWRVNRIQGRSYASPSERGVFVRIGSSIGTYIHEIAHAIETQDPRALARSLAFLKARTLREKAKKLAELLKIPGYGPLEVARPDKFVHAYMGKDYGSLATEITSMGYEAMADSSSGVNLRDLTTHDPEYFMFLLGQLAGR